MDDEDDGYDNDAYEDHLDSLAHVDDEDDGFYGPTDEFFYADEEQFENEPYEDWYAEDLP